MRFAVLVGIGGMVEVVDRDDDEHRTRRWSLRSALSRGHVTQVCRYVCRDLGHVLTEKLRNVHCMTGGCGLEGSL